MGKRKPADKRVVSVRLEPGLIEELEALAAQRGLTFSALVRHELRNACVRARNTPVPTPIRAVHYSPPASRGNPPPEIVVRNLSGAA